MIAGLAATLAVGVQIIQGNVAADVVYNVYGVPEHGYGEDN